MQVAEREAQRIGHGLRQRILQRTGYGLYIVIKVVRQLLPSM